jgi:hypothetical protein
MSQGSHLNPADLEWKCFRCNRKLVVGPVVVDYLGNNLSAELPQCPSCHMVFISEDLAMGKVAEVEKILEDK